MISFVNVVPPADIEDVPIMPLRTMSNAQASAPIYDPYKRYGYDVAWQAQVLSIWDSMINGNSSNPEDDVSPAIAMPRQPSSDVMNTTATLADGISQTQSSRCLWLSTSYTTGRTNISALGSGVFVTQNPGRDAIYDTVPVHPSDPDSPMEPLTISCLDEENTDDVRYSENKVSGLSRYSDGFQPNVVVPRDDVSRMFEWMSPVKGYFSYATGINNPTDLSNYQQEYFDNTGWGDLHPSDPAGEGTIYRWEALYRTYPTVPADREGGYVYKVTTADIPFQARVRLGPLALATVSGWMGNEVLLYVPVDVYTRIRHADGNDSENSSGHFWIGRPASINSIDERDGVAEVLGFINSQDVQHALKGYYDVQECNWDENVRQGVRCNEEFSVTFPGFNASYLCYFGFHDDYRVRGMLSENSTPIL